MGGAPAVEEDVVGDGVVVAADFDNGGFADLFSWTSLKLYRNDGGKGLVEVKLPELPKCVARGACWGDFDNDGLIDLFAGNFAHVDSRGDQPKSRFLRNLGPEKGHVFEDKGACGVFYQESYATPAAGDFDNDGDPDLAGGGKLFENEGSGGGWLKVRLAGDGKAVNRSAIGAQVRVKLKDRVLTRQVEAGTGEGNQNELTLHFGLGAHTGSVALEVLWPGGKTQTMRRVKTNRLVEIRYKGRR